MPAFYKKPTTISSTSKTIIQQQQNNLHLWEKASEFAGQLTVGKLVLIPAVDKNNNKNDIINIKNIINIKKNVINIKNNIINIKNNIIKMKNNIINKNNLHLREKAPEFAEELAEVETGAYTSIW